jgi:hypothetical protein
VAAVAAALFCVLPLLVEARLPPLAGALALAGAVAAVGALIVTPLLLAPAAGLYAVALVVIGHRGQLPLWTIPFLAVGLLLFHEAGDLRYRVPPGSTIDRGPLFALARRLALTAGLGLLASLVVVAAGSVASRGGVAAAVVGGVAVGGAALLVGKTSRR